jgi:hypothetical protein
VPAKSMFEGDEKMKGSLPCRLVLLMAVFGAFGIASVNCVFAADGIKSPIDSTSSLTPSVLAESDGRKIRQVARKTSIKASDQQILKAMIGPSADELAAQLKSSKKSKLKFEPGKISSRLSKIKKALTPANVTEFHSWRGKSGKTAKYSEEQFAAELKRVGSLIQNDFRKLAKKQAGLVKKSWGRFFQAGVPVGVQGASFSNSKGVNSGALSGLLNSAPTGVKGSVGGGKYAPLVLAPGVVLSPDGGGFTLEEQKILLVPGQDALDFLAGEVFPAAVRKAGYDYKSFSFKPGAVAEGKVKFKGDASTVIPKDTTLVRGDGREFRTTEKLTLSSGGSWSVVQVQAVDSGDEYNTADGETLTLKRAIGGVSAVMLKDAISGGSSAGGDAILWDSPGDCLSFRYLVSPLVLELPVDSQTLGLDWVASDQLKVKKIDLSGAAVRFSSSFEIATGKDEFCQFLFEDIEDFIEKYIDPDGVITNTELDFIGGHPLNASVEGVTLENFVFHLEQDASGFTVTSIEAGTFDLGEITVIGDLFSDLLDLLVSVWSWVSGDSIAAGLLRTIFHEAIDALNWAIQTLAEESGWYAWDESKNIPENVIPALPCVASTLEGCIEDFVEALFIGQSAPPQDQDRKASFSAFLEILGVPETQDLLGVIASKLTDLISTVSVPTIPVNERVSFKTSSDSLKITDELAISRWGGEFSSSSTSGSAGSCSFGAGYSPIALATYQKKYRTPENNPSGVRGLVDLYIPTQLLESGFYYGVEASNLLCIEQEVPISAGSIPGVSLGALDLLVAPTKQFTVSLEAGVESALSGAASRVTRATTSSGRSGGSGSLDKLAGVRLTAPLGLQMKFPVSVSKSMSVMRQSASLTLRFGVVATISNAALTMTADTTLSDDASEFQVTPSSGAVSGVTTPVFSEDSKVKRVVECTGVAQLCQILTQNAGTLFAQTLNSLNTWAATNNLGTQIEAQLNTPVSGSVSPLNQAVQSVGTQAFPASYSFADLGYKIQLAGDLEVVGGAMGGSDAAIRVPLNIVEEPAAGSDSGPKWQGPTQIILNQKKDFDPQDAPAVDTDKTPLDRIDP